MASVGLPTERHDHDRGQNAPSAARRSASDAERYALLSVQRDRSSVLLSGSCECSRDCLFLCLKIERSGSPRVLPLLTGSLKEKLQSLKTFFEMRGRETDKETRPEPGTSALLFYGTTIHMMQNQHLQPEEAATGELHTHHAVERSGFAASADVAAPTSPQTSKIEARRPQPEESNLLSEQYAEAAEQENFLDKLIARARKLNRWRRVSCPRRTRTTRICEPLLLCP